MSTSADLGSPAPQTTAAEAVFATISYTDVFDMPIDMDRLRRFVVGRKLTSDEVDAAVDELVGRGMVRRDRANDLVHLVGREEVLDVWAERTARAATMWADAERWGRRVGRVPFVRMVAVTGGLAADSVADHDDIDFFIVTKPGRLWLTRLMIIALGKVADRENIELCPNFIVSDQAIEMSVRTAYTARELAQMVAITGAELCMEVRERNSWMFDLLPNATVQGDLSRATDTRPSVLQRAAEALLATPLFAPLERWEMRRKIAKLTTVRSRRPEVGAPDESSFSPDVCKGHMVGNAAGIEVAWQARLDAAPAAGGGG